MQFIYRVDNIPSGMSSRYDFLNTHLITSQYFDLMFHGRTTDTFLNVKKSFCTEGCILVKNF